MKAMVIVNATRNSAAGVPPRARTLTEVCALHEEFAAGGLHPSAKGERIKLSGNSRKVIDSSFTETKALVARDWIWQVRPLEGAVEWARRCANPHPATAAIGSGRRLETT